MTIDKEELQACNTKVRTAATKGLILRISQPEAHALRTWLASFRAQNKEQRQWLWNLAKNVNLVTEFGIPKDVNLPSVQAFISALIEIDTGGGATYTQCQARNFRAYVAYLVNEQQFLLELQRDTLAHKRMVKDGA